MLLVKMLKEGLLKMPAAADELTGFSRLANLLRGLVIGRGRERHLDVLGKRIAAVQSRLEHPVRRRPPLLNSVVIEKKGNPADQIPQKAGTADAGRFGAVRWADLIANRECRGLRDDGRRSEGRQFIAQQLTVRVGRIASWRPVSIKTSSGPPPRSTA